MPVRRAPPAQLAFVYRNTAEKERRFGAAGRARQLAFVYRNTAEKERRLVWRGRGVSRRGGMVTTVLEDVKW